MLHRTYRPQADRVRWIRFVDPVPLSAALMQEAYFSELLAKLGHIDSAKPFVGRDGQLEGRTFQMVHENLEIIGFSPRLTKRPSEFQVRIPATLVASGFWRAMSRMLPKL